MKVSSIAIICLSSLAVTACSFTPREQAEGDFKYTNAKQVEPLKPAPGKQLPEASKQYEIPEVNATGATGKKINVLPPVLVRGTAAGSRASENADVTAVDFSELDGMDDLPSFTWEGIKAALARENLTIVAETAEQSLTTGWQRQQLEVGDDEVAATVERQFRVTMQVPDHRRTATVTVAMTDKKISGPGADMVPGGVSDANAEANLLNTMINEIAVRQQGVFAAAEAAATVNVQPSFNEAGYPAYELDIGFDVAWPLLADVLEGVGFEIDDLNQSAGMYYLEYMRDPGFSLAFWNDNQEGKLDLADGSYQVNVKGDDDSTTITIYRGETPLTAADIDRLYGPIAAEIRQRSAL
ncbi:outer membrane protein assembly factor BamC [Pseudidiomarina homiensis]|uniref:outer membrane protein assembly factor BamC n=1 Tax=Pseudidiomarina homiensis TaxID=364198 RepID=UPI00215AB043|nr:outer membrane protein assembly factor BamC [Pseudidiomarina homiensis]